MAFSRLAWALTLSAAVALGVGARIAINYEPDDLAAQWKPLFDKCRRAIEEARPLDVGGLMPLELSRRDADELFGSRARGRAFASGGAFAAIESEYGSPGKVTRICEIVRRPGMTSLTPAQLALLHYAFTREMNALATSQEPREVGIFPFVTSAFVARKLNPNGCSTIAVMRSTPWDRMPEHPPTFVTQVGEQSSKTCGAPSRLDVEMRQKL